MKMNKKAQWLDMDEINWAYVGLAFVGGILAFGIAGRVPGVSKLIPVMSGLATVVVLYFYLTLTDRG